MSTTIWGKGKSAKLLAKTLNFKLNDSRADTFIRWKRMEDLPGHVINKRNAVALASNKFKSLVVIQKAGVKTVPVSEIIPQDWRTNHSIIFGRSIYHTQGKDITVYSGSSARFDMYRHDYFTLYLKPESEYRYHVAFGKVIVATKKVLGEGQVDDTLIRNHQNGKWVQVTVRPIERYAKDCIKAVQALGLDFGAVDFLVHNGELYILEVNTAPGIETESRLNAYVEAFKEHMR